MGGNDSSSPHCVPTSPLELPKWTNLLERSHCPAAPGPKTRSESATSLEMTLQQRQAPEKAPAPAWNSAPASPEQQARSPRSSGTRSDGTVSPIRQYMECIEPQTLSCAVVGDSGVGKTSLLLSYTTGKIPAGHNPTVYDKFSTSISVYGKRISVTICDTSGQDDFANLRPLCYPQVDAVLICFSVVDSASYENIKSKWSKEIRRHCPGVPVILVGTQIDQRENSMVTKELKSRGLRTVSRSDGVKLASLIKATTYVECSSLRHLNVKNAFDEAIAAALEMSSSSRRRTPQCVAGCTIL